MTDWERVTPLADGRRVVTTAERREENGGAALRPRVTTAVWRGQECLGESEAVWYGAWPPVDEWLDLVHVAAVTQAQGPTRRDLRVATLDVPGHGRRYVVVEAIGGSLDVLTAPFNTAESADACLAWLRGEYDRLDGEWRVDGVRPIDVAAEFRQAVHA